jgi:hypothetical protein
LLTTAGTTLGLALWSKSESHFRRGKPAAYATTDPWDETGTPHTQQYWPPMASTR